jgi:hypothetical protein
VSSDSPYLSVVVCSRNDNHGGKLLERTQAFIDNVYMQSSKFNVSTELLMVEWNPPQDRPRLSQILELPKDRGLVSFRLITVPHALHAKLNHSISLPLYQMIAKNVGIRAARGEFVLATNVDILFSDEIFRVFSKKTLQKSRLYRADRLDVPTDTATKGTARQALEYASQHVIRVNQKDKTLDLETGRVQRIYSRRKGISVIQGILWYSGPAFVVNFAMTRFPLDWKRLKILLQEKPRRKVVVSTPRRRSERFKSAMTSIIIRMPPSLRKSFAPFVEPLEVIKWPQFDRKYSLRISYRPPSPIRNRIVLEIVQISQELIALPPPSVPRLYTNACGDFTLMSKEDWSKLRGYAEFEMSSLHIDSLLLYEAYYQRITETVLKGPIYHIDHTMGWSPVGKDSQSYEESMKKDRIPVLNYGDFLRLVEDMRSPQGNARVNRDNWGLAGEVLESFEVPSSGTIRSDAVRVSSPVQR